MENTRGRLRSVSGRFEAFRIQKVTESLSNPRADKGNLSSAENFFGAGGETAALCLAGCWRLSHGLLGRACDFLVGSTETGPHKFSTQMLPHHQVQLGTRLWNC